MIVIGVGVVFGAGIAAAVALGMAVSVALAVIAAPAGAADFTITPANPNSANVVHVDVAAFTLAACRT